MKLQQKLSAFYETKNMEKLMYSHTGKFKLIDFHVSHNEMLIRSYAFENRDYNIDILFKGVNSMNIVTSYTGLKILVTNKKEGQTPVFFTSDEFIFQLLDNFGVETYIEASAFGVFKNRLGFGETSLGDFLWSKDNECIFWSHEDAEFKNMFNIR